MTFIMVAVATTSLLAQAAVPSDKQQASIQPLSSGDGKAPGPTFLSSSSIEAGTSDTKATLSLVGFSPTTPIGDFLHYQLSGEAPVASKSSADETDIGTVSGLSAGANARAQISLMWWPRAASASTDQLTKLCQTEFSTLLPGFTWEESALSGVSETCSRALFKADEIQAIADGLNARLKTCRDSYSDLVSAEQVQCDEVLLGPTPPPPSQRHAIVAQCLKLKEMKPKDAKAEQTLQADKLNCGRMYTQARAQSSSLARDKSYLGRILAQVDGLERSATSPVTLLSFGTTVNRQKVTYFKPSDLSALITDHVTGYGGDITLSRIAGHVLYSGGFSYEKTFKSGDDSQFCAPVSGSTATKCQQGTLGVPKHTFARILFTETRVLIISGALAVSPRVEYDLTASKFAAKLPIYFAPNKDKALTGGVTLGYVTRGQGFGASVFVSKAFSLFQ